MVVENMYRENLKINKNYAKIFPEFASEKESDDKNTY